MLFGNAVGDTGTTTIDPSVTGQDATAITNYISNLSSEHESNAASITNVMDINRSGEVTAQDALIVIDLINNNPNLNVADISVPSTSPTLRIGGNATFTQGQPYTLNLV